MTESVDKTGQMRDPNDFAQAIVAWKRFVLSPEFIMLPHVAVFGLTILDALKIAHEVSSALAEFREGKHRCDCSRCREKAE